MQGVFEKLWGRVAEEGIVADETAGVVIDEVFGGVDTSKTGVVYVLSVEIESRKIGGGHGEDVRRVGVGCGCPQKVVPEHGSTNTGGRAVLWSHAKRTTQPRPQLVDLDS